jgi:hypothetical protein
MCKNFSENNAERGNRKIEINASQARRSLRHLSEGMKIIQERLLYITKRNKKATENGEYFSGCEGDQSDKLIPFPVAVKVAMI